MLTRKPLIGDPLAQGGLAPDTGPPGRLATWTIVSFLLAAAAALLVTQVGSALLLPAMGLLMVLTGLVLAAVLWFGGARTQHATLAWEMAGALVFFGFAALMLSDKADVLAAFNALEAQAIAALSR